MKTKNFILALVLLATNTQAFAHCPASFKAENVCLWLDKNTIYIYDHKAEHNGPYKDLKNAEVHEVKSTKGVGIPFKKVARGIFKLDSPEAQDTVTLVIMAQKKKTEIKISRD